MYVCTMHPLPEAFVERIKSQFPDCAESFLNSIDAQPRSSVRLNKARNEVAFIDASPIPWNDDGLFLSDRPKYTLDPRFHAGCYYPQESSSMVLQWVLKHCVRTDHRLDALDLCAAPGGKSLILSDYLKGNGRLVANEMVRSRAHILQEVLMKWGADNVVVTNNRPADFTRSGMQFDLLLVDAPCSGEGMFRKDVQARDEWNPQSAEMCSVRQREILDNVLPVLREGGVLIYSTCTFAGEENEEIIQHLLASGEFETLRWPVPKEWNLDVLDEQGVYAMRFLPHQAPGEGFFIAALKRISPSNPKRVKPKAVFAPLQSADLTVIRSMGLSTDRMVLAPDGDIYRSSFSMQELNEMASSLYLLYPGLHMGRIVRNELLPAHGLALACNELPVEGCLDLDLDRALAYLRGESVEVTAKSGWHRVAFEGSVLGWIKVIGNRINNYYPKEWRVKMKE
jgi:16S rRNA C967 or C1407 C5-methylase (RsmB/RsmF family)/NOL1/NOP2/fmu family ribosome biogenesis protein